MDGRLERSSWGSNPGQFACSRCACPATCDQLVFPPFTLFCAGQIIDG